MRGTNKNSIAVWHHCERVLEKFLSSIWEYYNTGQFDLIHWKTNWKSQVKSKRSFIMVIKRITIRKQVIYSINCLNFRACVLPYGTMPPASPLLQVEILQSCPAWGCMQDSIMQQTVSASIILHLVFQLEYEVWEREQSSQDSICT